MVNLKEIKWDAIKELCDKVAGVEEKANKLGLTYIFVVEVGIWECKVYSALYRKIKGGGADLDLAKYHEYNYFDKRAEFDAHLAEVEKILTEGWSIDKAYAEELSKLNKKYGK